MSQKSTRTLEIYVGACLVAGLIITSGLVLAFSSGAGIFEETYKVVVRIDAIAGLKAGAPVRMGGFDIGQVEDISLMSDHIEIVAAISSTVALKDDTKAKIAGAGLVGDAFLEMTRGKSPGTLDTRVGTVQAARLKNSIEGISAPGIEALFERVDVIGVELTAMLRSVNTLAGDEKLQEDIRQSVANVNRTTEEAERLLISLRKSSGNIEKASGQLSAIVQDVQATVAEVRAASAKTIGNEANIENLNQTLADIRFTVGRFRQETDNLSAIIANVTRVSDKVAAVSDTINVEKVNKVVDELFAGISSASDLVAKVRDEITMALVINKGADRIVAKKFDELKRQYGRSLDAAKMLEEFTTWTRERINQGWMEDPKFPREKRPYHQFHER